MARVRTGYYGKGMQVRNCTVSSALTAVGQMIALACNNNNPTKIKGSDKLLPRLQIMLGGYGKEDPATIKKLPVQADGAELFGVHSLSREWHGKGQQGLRGSNDNRVQLPSPHEGIHRQGILQFNKANRAIQVQGCDLFPQKRQGASTMPPAKRTRRAYRVSR
jgi:hypothetical protein